MAVLLPADWAYPLPKLRRVRQQFEAVTLADPAARVREQLAARGVRACVKPGARVAVGVGSRGIANLPLIVRTVLDVLREWGAEPFIVSAMGSHGNGNEAGQREVLAGYGITEAAMGVPVVTTTESVLLGHTPSGVPVWFDKAALAADLIVPINRIKLHTDFIGPLQSGLCKMLVIGLGNQQGCTTIHDAPPEQFAAVLEAAARVILAQAPVGFGVGIIENAYDQTADIQVLPAATLIDEEKSLVKKATGFMPRIMLKSIDVLIMEEIGKDVSGAGFDPNIVGRSSARDEFIVPIPAIQRMVLLGVTPQSHGNGIGLGLFDVMLKDIFPTLDLEAIYTNAVACRCIADARIPLMAASEEEAVRIAVKSCRRLDLEKLKIVRIKNTLSLGEIEVSPALFPEVEQNPQQTLLAEEHGYRKG